MRVWGTKNWTSYSFSDFLLCVLGSTAKLVRRQGSENVYTSFYWYCASGLWLRGSWQITPKMRMILFGHSFKIRQMDINIVRWGPMGGRGRKEGRKIGNIEENGKAASSARLPAASPGLDGRMGYMRNHKGGSKNWHYHACCAIQHGEFEVKLGIGQNKTHNTWQHCVMPVNRYSRRSRLYRNTSQWLKR